jgi:hypothetical protein
LGLAEAEMEKRGKCDASEFYYMINFNLFFFVFLLFSYNDGFENRFHFGKKVIIGWIPGRISGLPDSGIIFG